ncbi:hypothetical protein CER19_05020 [Pseudomonas sp. GL93]|uniref:Arc family DNA-binding protein n=1 Tax=Pseudomonas sp. GL93 TaxID=2014741 RepID=UPI000E30F180|nr:Arc family DNA-binding protein [Pseudomonas sp. GL93]RFD32523.1 hypothetical protein CER19_05020 [Pseudomonas sp. GL93]
MPNNVEPFIVRLPSQLHAKIKSIAKADRRSMNNEIVGRLERSFQASHAKIADENLRRFLIQQLELLDNKVESDEHLSADH